MKKNVEGTPCVLKVFLISLSHLKQLRTLIIMVILLVAVLAINNARPLRNERIDT